MAQLVMMWHGMHSSKAAVVFLHKRMQGVCTALMEIRNILSII